MKKFIALLFAVVMMVSMIGTCFAAVNPANCAHRNCGWKTKTAATCTTGGTDWYYCKDCGKDLYFRSTAALGHNMQGRSCTTAEKCTRCGATGQAAYGHSWVCKRHVYVTVTYLHTWDWQCSRCSKWATTSKFSVLSNPPAPVPSKY